jgi:polyribonucleotide 5'-hydroxyl-kinase
MIRRFEERQQNPVTVIKLAKSGGCVDREESYLAQTREIAIKEYFFGEPKRTLSPYTVTTSFDDLRIWRIGLGRFFFFFFVPAFYVGGVCAEDEDS